MTFAPRATVISALSAVHLLCVTGALAQPLPVPLERLLAQPLSNGSLALLIEHTDSPAARERISAALVAAEPELRGIAARIVFAKGVSALRPAVLQALVRETEAEPAFDLVRAAASLAQPADAPVLVAAARKWQTGAVLARQLAFSVPATNFAGQWAPALVLLGLNLDSAWGDVVRLVCRRDPSALRAFGEAALSTREATLWTVVLRGDERLGSLGDDLVSRGLASAAPSIRSASAWYIATRKKPKGGAAKTARAALSSASVADGEDRHLAAGLMLAARAMGVQRTGPGLVDYISRETTYDSAALVPDPVCRLVFARDLLTGDEKRAAGRPLELAKLLQPSATYLEPEARAREQQFAQLIDDANTRTPWSLPRGFLSGAVAASGCSGSSAGWMGGRVTFGPDGRVSALQLSADTAGDGCGAVVRAALQALAGGFRPAVGIHGVSPGMSALVLVSLRPDHVTCFEQVLKDLPQSRGLSYAAADDDSSFTDARPRTEPLSLPGFTVAAGSEEALVSGIVSTTGCVSLAQVSQSAKVGPKLVALQNVLERRYDPARVKGQPVAEAVSIVVGSGGTRLRAESLYGRPGKFEPSETHYCGWE